MMAWLTGKDVMELLYRVGTHDVYEWTAGVNYDGKIDMGDVILLLNRIGNPAKYELKCCE